MEQFKKAEFLEVGKVYADVEIDNGWATYLKFLGSNPDKDDSVLFEYISGLDMYLRNHNGLISFPLEMQELSDGAYSCGISDWYIPTEEFLKSINCTKL